MKIVRMILTILQINSDDNNDSDDNTLITIIMIGIMIKETIIKIITTITIKQII